MRLATLAWLPLLLLVSSCETAYYDAMEKVGVHKREILIDRIVEAQESQEEGKEQFKSALEQFRSVVNFDGGELEATYEKLNDEYEDSVSAAETIHKRIASVESVATALFDEWTDELALYSSASLRRDSERQLQSTKKRYERLLATMHRTEKTIEPVLASLQDNVLYLKHNLNSRAIASLKGEFANVNADVTKLVSAMQKAIDESNKFVEELRGAP
jgi:chromosome segregation ATPase